MLSVQAQRVFLPQSYKEAIANLKDTQQILSSVNQKLRRVPGIEKEVWAKDLITNLSAIIVAIGSVLNTSSNKDLTESGGLYELNEEINRFINRKDAGGSLLIKETLNAYMDSNRVDQLIQRVQENTKNTYDLIEKGEKSKGFISENLPSRNIGQFLSSHSTTLLGGFGAFAPILSTLGGAAYNLWDETNRKRYEKRLPILKSGIQSLGRGGLGAQKSTKGEDEVSGLPQQGGVLSGSLFEFFNRDAYKARWTRELLGLVAKIAGGSIGGNKGGSFWSSLEGTALGQFVSGWFGKITGFFSRLFGGAFSFIRGAISTLLITPILTGLRLLGTGLVAVLSNPLTWSAIGGGLIGYGIRNSVKLGDKTIGQHLDSLQDNYFLKKALQDKANTVTNDPITKRALQLQAQNITLKPAEAVAIARKEVAQKPDNTTAIIKVLEVLVAETKAGNEKKLDREATPTSKSNIRQTYKDTGNPYTDLINSANMGQPRR